MKTNAKKVAIARRTPKTRAIARRTPKTRAIARREPPTLAEAIEKVLIGGDLTPLSVPERLDYYKKVCQSLGLNPLTRPFDYIAYQGKLTLYARRDCTDQLRRIHGVSVSNMKRDFSEGMCSVEVEVTDRTGRSDCGTGVVCTVNLKGTDLANAIMKAETKAKRRATLSVCGLGFLDQSEIDGLAEYNKVTPGGRLIIEPQKRPAINAPEIPQKHESITVTPWKEGRAALSGDGLPILKAELTPEFLEELDIKYNGKEKVVHMKASEVFKLIDRADNLGIATTLSEQVSPSRGATEAATGAASPKEMGTAPVQGNEIESN